MDPVVTLAKRKEAEVRRRKAAVSSLRRVLAKHARSKGGRYLLFGSAARDEMRYDSDVDIIVDFPDSATAEAWRFAEQECRKLGLTPDVRSLSYCEPEFLSAVSAQIKVLG